MILPTLLTRNIWDISLDISQVIICHDIVVNLNAAPLSNLQSLVKILNKMHLIYLLFICLHIN